MARRKRNNLIFIDNEYQPAQSKQHHGVNLIQKLRRISFKNYFIVFLGILIIVIGYLFSPLGHVRTISVTGTNYLGAQQIIDASQIKNESLVINTLIHKKSIYRRIQRQVPLVKTVNYHYQDFNNLKINVHEYQTVGFLLKNGGYYRILENSRILSEKLAQPIGNFPVYQDFGTKTSLAKFVQLYLHLPAKLRNDISEIHGNKNIKNQYRITLYMNDGNIVIGDIRTLQDKLQYYPEIAKQMPAKGIVNLELGAYSKSFPKKK